MKKWAVFSENTAHFFIFRMIYFSFLKTKKWNPHVKEREKMKKREKTL